MAFFQDYCKFRIKTTTLLSDLLADALMERGFEGVQIEDHVPLTKEELGSMFADIAPDFGEDDGTAFLSIYVPYAEEGVQKPETEQPLLFKGAPVTKSFLLEEIKAAQQEALLFTGEEFTPSEEPLIEISDTRNADWANNWKKYFHGFTINDLRIEPSWNLDGKKVRPESAENIRHTLIIDPGPAFGTGSHETTRLCIEGIQHIFSGSEPPEELLHIGTGSGILGIVALLYGACNVIGTDIDPLATVSAKENMERNGIAEDRYALFLGTLITDASFREEICQKSRKLPFQGFPLVTANLLAEILVELAPVLPSLMAKEGRLISSGILKEKAGKVQEAYEKAGLKVLEVRLLGDWAAVDAVKKA